MLVLLFVLAASVVAVAAAATAFLFSHIGYIPSLTAFHTRDFGKHEVHCCILFLLMPPIPIRPTDYSQGMLSIYLYMINTRPIHPFDRYSKCLYSSIFHHFSSSVVPHTTYSTRTYFFPYLTTGKLKSKQGKHCSDNSHSDDSKMANTCEANICEDLSWTTAGEQMSMTMSTSDQHKHITPSATPHAIHSNPSAESCHPSSVPPKPPPE